MAECKNCGHRSHLHSPSCMKGDCPCSQFIGEELARHMVTPKSACDACGTGGLLLSADGTESCDIWNCIRCHVHMVVHQEVAALGIKELVKETITEAVTQAFKTIRSAN